MDSSVPASSYAFFPFKNVSSGFTLVELIVVIAILGILSAVAIPRLIDLTDNARESNFNNMKETILSAAEAAHSQHVMLGTGPDEPITVNGKKINMTNGYPDDDSISLLVDIEGFSYDPVRAWWYIGSTTCRIDYNKAGWKTNPDKRRPNVKFVTTGC